MFVFDANHKFHATFGSDRMQRPSGVAVDNKNRLLYVTDVLKNNVVVYDLDSFKYVRTIGGPPQKMGDDSPGTFARPTNVAVGPNGDVYISDTLNGRIQIFDADGTFISAFGKPGDGPADFARPKGIALDSDGHIWVADADQNRVKVFDREGRLCAYFGEYGYFPGQFALPSGVTLDKNNRVIVAEQVLNGRLQVFRYTTEAEAAVEQAKRDHPGGTSTVQAAPPAGDHVNRYVNEFVFPGGKRRRRTRVEVLKASAAVQTTLQEVYDRMKKFTIILLVMVVTAFAGTAMAQFTLDQDVLGAHNVNGRGCVSCHLPHSGSAGSGGTDGTGTIVLWGISFIGKTYTNEAAPLYLHVSVRAGRRDPLYRQRSA